MMFVDGGWLYPATTAFWIVAVFARFCRSSRPLVCRGVCILTGNCMDFGLFCIRISLVCVCVRVMLQPPGKAGPGFRVSS